MRHSAMSAALSAITLLIASADAYPFKHPVHPPHPAHPSDSVMYNALDENSPAEFQFSGHPIVSVIDKNRKFAFEAGGFVKFTASCDFGAPLDNPNEFITSAIPVAGEPGNKELLQFSAMQSSLYVNFVALPESANAVGAFVGMNFLDNYTPVVQFAYLRWRGLKIGYDYTAFSDPEADAPTIDYEGPGACTSVPVAQITYTHRFGKQRDWQVGGGLQMPLASYTTSSRFAVVNQRIPEIPLFLRHDFANGAHIKLSAIIRGMTYRDIALNKNGTKTGWGLQLAGISPIVGELSCFWQATYGNGIASLMQNYTDGGYDLCPTSGSDPEMKCVRAWGAVAGLTYALTSKMTTSAGYSQNRLYNSSFGGDNPDAPGERIRYTQYAFANVMYNMNRWLQCGVEYIYGRRMNNDAAQGHTSRVQVAAQLTF